MNTIKVNRKKLHELLDVVLDVHETKGFDGWFEISGHVDWISVATSLTGSHITKISDIDYTDVYSSDEVFNKVIKQYKKESSNKALAKRKKQELVEKEKAELKRLKNKYENTKVIEKFEDMSMQEIMKTPNQFIE